MYLPFLFATNVRKSETLCRVLCSYNVEPRIDSQNSLQRSAVGNIWMSYISPLGQNVNVFAPVDPNILGHAGTIGNT